MYVLEVTSTLVARIATVWLLGLSDVDGEFLVYDDGDTESARLGTRHVCSDITDIAMLDIWLSTRYAPYAEPMLLATLFMLHDLIKTSIKFKPSAHDCDSRGELTSTAALVKALFGDDVKERDEILLLFTHMKVHKPSNFAGCMSRAIEAGRIAGIRI